MRAQLVIDHVLFRKLFAESFSRGLGDEYNVTKDGVRWHKSEDDFQKESGHLFGPSDTETIAMMEIIRDARLDFPCSPDQAVAWIERSADTWTYVPDWLKNALRQDNADAALKVLNDAAAALDKEITKAYGDNDHETADDASKERKSLDTARGAFEEIRKKLPLIPDHGNGQVASSAVDWPWILPNARAAGRVVESALKGIGQKDLNNVSRDQVLTWLREHQPSQQDITIWKVENVERGQKQIQFEDENGSWKILKAQAVTDALKARKTKSKT